MVCFAFFINKLIAPHKPNPEKLTSYECGEEPTGSAWMPFNSRFYVIALIFLLFDVEMVFIFPWATVFGSHEINNYDPRWGWLALTEMFIFLGILILGLTLALGTMLGPGLSRTTRLAADGIPAAARRRLGV